ncbi:MAG: asparagine synthetase B, partial [Bacteroidota bacterium]
MCGIAGFYSSKGKFSEADLNTITASLAHRGPDAAGHFFDRICGLGHRRLSILDLSSGANQPMYTESRRYVMVFNGEVYNYQSLKEKL